MIVSFAPLRPDATEFISDSIGIDYRPAFPFVAPRWFCATARDDDGGIMGVVLAEFINGFEAYFNVAVANPRCVTRRVLRAIFTALFSRAVRLTAFVDVDNRRGIRTVIALGFLHEGYCRLGINGIRDAYSFSMLRSDCRLLSGHVVSTVPNFAFPDQRMTRHG